MSRAGFLCMDCGIDTGRAGEYYALRDEVWFEAHSCRTGMLCVGCIETRLGRRLVHSDFNASYLNRPGFGNKSVRLVSRMTQVPAVTGLPSSIPKGLAQ